MDNLLFTVFYTHERDMAHIRIAGENASDLDVSVLVAHIATVEAVRFNGNEASPKLEVSDTDRVIILVDQQGELVAHGIYEVATALCEHGYLLMPRGGANVLLDQEEQLRESELDDGDGFDKIQTREEQ